MKVQTRKEIKEDLKKTYDVFPKSEPELNPEQKKYISEEVKKRVKEVLKKNRQEAKHIEENDIKKLINEFEQGVRELKRHLAYNHPVFSELEELAKQGKLTDKIIDFFTGMMLARIHPTLATSIPDLFKNSAKLKNSKVRSAIRFNTYKNFDEEMGDGVEGQAHPELAERAFNAMRRAFGLKEKTMLEAFNERTESALKIFTSFVTNGYKSKRDCWFVNLAQEGGSGGSDDHETQSPGMMGGMYLIFFALKSKINSCLSNQVEVLCQYMASKDVANEKKEALLDSINKLLGNNLKEKFDIENLGVANGLLTKAIEKKYPNEQNKWEVFLKSLQVKMEKDYPQELEKSPFDTLVLDYYKAHCNISNDYTLLPCEGSVENDHEKGAWNAAIEFIKTKEDLQNGLQTMKAYADVQKKVFNCISKGVKEIKEEINKKVEPNTKQLGEQTGLGEDWKSGNGLVSKGDGGIISIGINVSNEREPSDYSEKSSDSEETVGSSPPKSPTKLRGEMSEDSDDLSLSDKLTMKSPKINKRSITPSFVEKYEEKPKNIQSVTTIPKIPKIPKETHVEKLKRSLSCPDLSMLSK